MRTPALPSPHRIAVGAGLAVLAAGLAPVAAASANPAGTGLVISEVYGAGGNNGATYNADFVEIHNPTAAALSLVGKTLEYRSASGGTGGSVALSGSIAAGGRVLVRMSDIGTTGAALPTPDVTAPAPISMSGTNGQVLLIAGSSPFTGSGNVAGNTGLVDMVGYGTTPTTFETAPTGVALTATTSAQRAAGGADTDANAADFSELAPTPQGGGLAAVPPTQRTASIAQIQGTGATSPFVGDIATTTGVVTAVYPTGGFNGFTIQTGGTGGATDATPGASDGIFVYGGPSGFTTYPEVGDSVQVKGTVAEFTSSGASLTQLTNAAFTELGAPLAAVSAVTGPWWTTDAEREAHESELFDPTGDFTVTNSYATWQFGEVGLATGTTPLVAPTEVRDAQTGNPGQIAADNARRLVTLDDGKSQNFAGSASDVPMSWVDATRPVRVGAAATLKGTFVVDHRNGLYKLQPTVPLNGLGADVAEFENTRTRNLAPADVGGDIRLATFNVLNYFPTTGTEYVASGAGTCTYYNDRAGDPVTVNSCTNNGPRGAADQDDFLNQQAKIVAAINRLRASVVSLEEIENSVKFGKDRDDAVRRLVTALNSAAGAGTWDYVRSPAAADRPSPADEDVIRTAFIYKPADVTPVGASAILKDEVNFDNAREPLAQAFKAVGAPDSEAFGVVVNHFKSKGSGADDGTGQGLANADRVGQANALSAFAGQFASDRGIDAMFLAGDFNAYSKEDPVQALEAAGYTKLESTDDPTEESYSFQGLSGSLDHVFANGAAKALVTGVDVWRINADETLGYQYSRSNYNVTDLYAADQFNASDHNPEIVGVKFPEDEGTTEVNLLNINDFHGRIDANTTKFATTIEQLRYAEGEANTLFLSAGDNIGASLFASAVQDDDPTLDVLDALDLRSSAVGNHEFDQGFADLRDDVIPDVDFSHLGANVYRMGTTTPVLDEYDIFEVNGVRVGVIGAVTEETPSLVSPGGIADLTFGDPVAAVNRVAARLSDGIETPRNGEADVIVAEYHEGAGASLPDSATCAEEVADGGTFARIATKTSAEVDAIFTGHTHKVYACDLPVPGGKGKGKSKTRPVLQTGSYGENVGQIVLTVDNSTGEVESYRQRNVARAAAENRSYSRVRAVKEITDAALAEAARVGNQPVGRIADDITTAYTGGTYGPDGYTVANPSNGRDDRAAESTLGGFVANALRDGVSEFAQPDLGLTNPGGLRAELLYAGNTSSNPLNTDGVVTYAEANAVLPFNNTVAIVQLTGAQLKEVLEQQWQTNADGTVPSRPYLQLGLSDNVEVVADESKPAGSRIVSVHIDGQPLDAATTYTVSTLSFLAQGGDNFRAFTEGTYVDTGLLDAQLWRDYLSTGTEAAPLAPDFARQQVFADGLAATFTAGETSSFALGRPTGDGVAPITGTTLNLTSLGSPANTSVVATLVSGTSETGLGTFAVTNGVASVTLEVPAGSEGSFVRLVAQPSGTTVEVPVTAP